MRNKEIAYELHLTEGTVKQYLNRICAKTGHKTRIQLAVWSFASRHGLTPEFGLEMASPDLAIVGEQTAEKEAKAS